MDTLKPHSAEAGNIAFKLDAAKAETHSTMKWLTLAFGLLVMSIIAAANSGTARPVFAAVGRVPGGDKICHFALAGGFCFLTSMALTRARTKGSSKVILAVIVAFLAMTTVEELSQLWLTRRTFSFSDMACNYAGVLAFGFLAIWLQSRNSS